MHRITRIVGRYLPCEIAGAVTAIAVGSFTFALTASPVLGAIGATLGENLGYYAIAAIAAWRRERPDAPDARIAVIRCVRSMVVEFGPAEVVDTLVARPLLMLAAATLMDSAPAAWLVGKLFADVVFYAIVIGCWRWAEARRASQSAIGSGSPGAGGCSTMSSASSRVNAPGKL